MYKEEAIEHLKVAAASDMTALKALAEIDAKAAVAIASAIMPHSYRGADRTVAATIIAKHGEAKPVKKPSPVTKKEAKK